MLADMARLAARCALVLMLLSGCGEPEAPADCVHVAPSISEGFGARGHYVVAVESLPNPRRPDQRVSLFLPEAPPAPVPVVLFAHANEQGNPATYAALIDHIVSRGYAVVFSSYLIGSANHRDRYETLWAGFEAGIDAIRDRLDVSRMGFVGHSYGAGALPFVAHRAMQAKGWGTEGAFMYSMAPWYALLIEPEELRELPDHLRILIQVFEEDTATDHRIAIEQFHAFSVPDEFKEFILVQSDSRGGCNLPAVHTVPQSTGLRARDDALDEYAIYRIFDALAAFAFSGDAGGRRIVFGRGSAAQIDMGRWQDGTPVAALVSSRNPRPLRPESNYIFRQSDRDAWRRYGEGAISPGDAARTP
jgi:hypothetical protein